MSDSTREDEAARSSRRMRRSARRHPLLAMICVVAVAALTAGLAGYLSGPAHGISSVAAVENINSADVPIGYSADTADSTWTNLGSIALTPGGSYAVSASVGLRDVDPGLAATGECVLSAPNEPFDLEDASLLGTKGSYTGNLALEGLTQLVSAQGASISGSVSLLCRVTSPGAAAGVVASDARVIAIPVDTVVNNLKTFRCGPLGAPPC